MNEMGGGRRFIIHAVLCVSCVSAPVYADDHAPHAMKVPSEPVMIDRVYKSMEGLRDEERFHWPARPEQPELLWVTGGQIDMLKAEDGLNDTERFLCHAYLKFEDRYFKAHRQQSPAKQINPQGRLFTFVQGQPAIRLPRGFGIPVLSTEPFEFEYMVINPTAPKEPFHVKAQGTFEYVRDGELQEPLKPLFMRILGMHVPIKTGSARPHAQCSELGDPFGGTPAAQVATSAEPAQSSLHKIHQNRDTGFEQVYHWMVPPGRHVYHYQLESRVFASLPFDTTVHYINAHLHPHGEFIELRDVTTSQTIFRSTATNNPDRSGLLKLTDFSSEEGIMISRDHQYEMLVGYHNTTDHDIDAMAILFVYLLDKTFDRAQFTTASGL